MRNLTLAESLELHRLLIEQSGGAVGLRDIGELESALAQPRVTFDEKELYPTIEEKAIALCFSLVRNHPFVDGNKRIGHAAMEMLLLLNGRELDSSVDDAEQVIFSLAAGYLSHEELLAWVRQHVVAV